VTSMFGRRASIAWWTNEKAPCSASCAVTDYPAAAFGAEFGNLEAGNALDDLPAPNFATALATLTYPAVRIAALTLSDAIGESVQHLRVFVTFTSGCFQLLAIENADFAARIAD
jgi:hypothetical protein